MVSVKRGVIAFNLMAASTRGVAACALVMALGLLLSLFQKATLNSPEIHSPCFRSTARETQLGALKIETLILKLSPSANNQMENNHNGKLAMAIPVNLVLAVGITPSSRIRDVALPGTWVVSELSSRDACCHHNRPRLSPSIVGLGSLINPRSLLKRLIINSLLFLRND